MKIFTFLKLLVCSFTVAHCASTADFSSLQQNTSGTLGSLLMPAFEGNLAALSFLNIKSKCFAESVSEAERRECFNDRIFGIILAIYDCKVEGSDANLAVGYLFEKMLEFGVDFAQTRELCLQNNPTEAKTYSLLDLLLVVAIESCNVQLIHLSMQRFPQASMQIFKQNLFKSSGATRAVTLAAIELFRASVGLFLQLAFDPETPKFGKLLFLRVCALEDVNGAILNDVFALLSDREKNLTLGYLLEIDGWYLDKAQRLVIHQRNIRLFNSFAPVSNGEALLFFTLNDWKFGANPFDHARFDDALLKGPFSCFQLQLAKTSVQSRHYRFIAPQFYPSRITKDMDEIFSDFVFLDLMETNITFNSEINWHLPEKLCRQLTLFDEGLQYYFSRFQAKSVTELIQNRELKRVTALNIALIYASPKALHLVFKHLRLNEAIVLDTLDLLFKIRGQKEDLYDWITEIFNLLVSKGYRHGGKSHKKISLQHCPLSVVAKMLTEPDLKRVLDLSYGLETHFEYSNFEVIFKECIQSKLHYGKFIRHVFRITRMYQLFFNDNELLFDFIIRCDSIDSVRRLLELVRLHIRQRDFLFGFEFILEILRKNPIDRILSLKWALLFWQTENYKNFQANCPEQWKDALINQ